MDDKALLKVAEILATLLIKNNKCLAVAESCTGGWIAKVLTDLSGSSDWFERGFVTYSNQSKQEMLAVTASTLQTYGAVSQQTVEAMALGALNHSQANYSLSISGIAGPGGVTKDKPAGLVWFAWANKTVNKANIMASEMQVLSGDREAVRRQAVLRALTGLINLLEASAD